MPLCRIFKWFQQWWEKKSATVSFGTPNVVHMDHCHCSVGIRTVHFVVTFPLWASIKAFYTIFIYFLSIIITTERKNVDNNTKGGKIYTALAQTIKIGCRFYRMWIQTKNALSKPIAWRNGFLLLRSFSVA